MDFYISDNNIIEGLCGIIGLMVGFIFEYDILRRIGMEPSLMYEIIIRWAIMWAFRKIGLNLYISIKRKYNMKHRLFVIAPHPKIIGYTQWTPRWDTAPPSKQGMTLREVKA